MRRGPVVRTGPEGGEARSSARPPRTEQRGLATAPLMGALLAAMLLAAALSGCKGSEAAAPPLPSLPLIGSLALDINEPSDLAIDETGTKFWTVTNNPDSVVQFDAAGKRVKTLSYAGQDLEGVAYDPVTSTLWVAEENRRSLVHMDLDGNVIKRHDLALTGDQNSGLEGVCFDGSGSMVVLNEKLPGMFIQLAPDVTIASKDTLTFAGDYSGITYDAAASKFWIVSDQSHRLYLWSKAGGIAKEFDLPFLKAEGVAYNPALNRIYVVSDSERRMYVYQYTP